MMLLKHFVNLINLKESEDSILYVYYKNKNGADSYGYYNMNSKIDIEKVIREYGEVGIESFHCGTLKYNSNEDKIALKVIISDYATPKKEEDTISDNAQTNVLIIQRSNSDDVVIKTNNKKITLSEDGKDIIISEKG